MQRAWSLYDGRVEPVTGHVMEMASKLERVVYELYQNKQLT